nr:hypothetical protein [Tanacetum cinerariifolium]
AGQGRGGAHQPVIDVDAHRAPGRRAAAVGGQGGAHEAAIGRGSHGGGRRDGRGLGGELQHVAIGRAHGVGSVGPHRVGGARRQARGRADEGT